MINYIVQVLLFQTVFLAVYDILLKKETFFQWNRAYLILTSVLAYILPLFKFQTLQENIPQDYVVMLPEVMRTPSTFLENKIDWSAILFEVSGWIFFIGVLVAGVLFIFKLIKIFRLIYQNEKENKENYSLVLLKDQQTAFSFFKYIFIGKTINNKVKIINHEIVHVKQKHSIDLLLFEIQKILFWFNPYSYLYQNRIADIHEFIADSRSVSRKEKNAFFKSLLAEAFQVDNFAFINSFNKKSLIKKRIIMFSKNSSKEILKFKYLLIAPILFGMLIYTSCESKSNGEMEDSKIEKIDNSKKDDQFTFTQLKQAPIYPGCENAEDPKKCLQDGIMNYVASNFDASIQDNLDLESKKQRVYVQFTIDKEGKIIDATARGPHKSLETEALRVINNLPQMQPGEYEGKKVNTQYTLPINLVID